MDQSGKDEACACVVESVPVTLESAPAQGWVLLGTLENHYVANAETQKGKRAGSNFLSPQVLRPYNWIGFQSVDKEPATLTVYADHGGLGGYHALGTMTLYKGNVQKMQINSTMREADGLFPAGVSSGCTFRVFGYT